MKDFWIQVFSGGVLVCVIEGIREALRFRRERKARREDNAEKRTEERISDLEGKVDALVESSKYMLYDRVRYLGTTYLADGKIDFDDRRILNDMHRVYHERLKGNGDLDVLMKSVNDLPLITY